MASNTLLVLYGKIAPHLGCVASATSLILYGNQVTCCVANNILLVLYSRYYHACCVVDTALIAV